MVVLFSVSEHQERKRVKIVGNFCQLEVLIVKEKDPVHLSQGYMNLVLLYFGMFPKADQWNKVIKDFPNVSA